MQDGTAVGAALAAPVAISRTTTTELDLYNARSIKLAEATRVRLFLPGLKGGPMDEWDDPQDAKAAAQAAAAAAARGHTDTALKSRKKLAKVAALAHANDPVAPAGRTTAADGAGGGGAGAENAMMMVVEAIMVLEDDEDDDGMLLLAPPGAVPGHGGVGAVGWEGGYMTGSGTVGNGQQRLSPGYDSERGAVRAGSGGRYYLTPGAGGAVPSGAAGASMSTSGAHGRSGGAVSAGGGGGGGGGRIRPGSATNGGGRPASASARRAGDGHISVGGVHGEGGGGNHPRLRTGHVSGSAGGADASAAAPRVPVWARLATNTPPREKIVPPPPKVYRAVRGKTLSLGLGGPDEGPGLFMVADPAAPYYGIEPGNGSGVAAAAVAAAAAAAAVNGRMGWPVVPPVPGMVKTHGTASGGVGAGAAAHAASVTSARVNGISSNYGVSYDGDSASAASARRIPDSPLHGSTAQGGVGPNVAFVRSRRLGSGASPSKGPSPSPPPPPPGTTAATAATAPPSPLSGTAPGSYNSATATATANGGGNVSAGSGAGAGAGQATLTSTSAVAATAGASSGGNASSSAAAAAAAAVGSPSLHLAAPQRVQHLTRVTSEVSTPGAPSSPLHKVHSSELPSDSSGRTPSGSSSWGPANANSWSGSPGPPPQAGRLGLSPPPPAAIAGLMLQPQQHQQHQQQQQGGVLTAWADPNGGSSAANPAAAGGGMSYNAMRAITYGNWGMQGQLSPGRLSIGSLGLSSGGGGPMASGAGAGGVGGGGVMLSSGPVRPSMLGLTATAAGANPAAVAVGVGPVGTYVPRLTPPGQQQSSSPQPQPFSVVQQQPTYHHIAGPGSSNGHGATYQQSDGYGSYGGSTTLSGAAPRPHVATPAPGAARGAAAGSGPATLYSNSRGGAGPGGGLLFATGSTPQITAATLAAVAAAAGAVAASAGTVANSGDSFSGVGGISGSLGSYDNNPMLLSRLRSSSFNQLAPQGR